MEKDVIKVDSVLAIYHVHESGILSFDTDGLRLTTKNSTIEK